MDSSPDFARSFFGSDGDCAMGAAFTSCVKRQNLERGSSIRNFDTALDRKVAATLCQPFLRAFSRTAREGTVVSLGFTGASFFRTPAFTGFSMKSRALNDGRRAK